MDLLQLTPLTNVSTFSTTPFNLNMNTINTAGFSVHSNTLTQITIGDDGTNFSNLLIEIKLSQNSVDQNFS